MPIFNIWLPNTAIKSMVSGSRKQAQRARFVWTWEELENRIVPSTLPVSDDFTSVANSSQLWSFVDPVGNSVFEFDEGAAHITVPAGTDHDVWSSGLDAARLVQPADSQNFYLEAKFDSLPSSAYALNGFLIEGADESALRFDFVSNGNQLKIFSAQIANGQATVTHSQVVVPTAPLYMSVTRSGSQWLQQYSLNGQLWVPAANFSYALDVTQVGIFAGNAGGTSAPEFTGIVDYFFAAEYPLQIAVDPLTTNDSSPALSGTVSDPTAAVAVSVAGNTYTAVNNGDGTWTLADDAISTLPDGEYDVIAQATSSGQTRIDTNPLDLLIDTQGPTVTVNTLSTPTSTPSISGTVNDPNATIQVTLDGEVYSATNNGNGSWWVLGSDLVAPLDAGVYDVVVLAQDALGNETSDSTPNELPIDPSVALVTVDQVETKE